MLIALFAALVAALLLVSGLVTWHLLGEVRRLRWEVQQLSAHGETPPQPRPEPTTSQTPLTHPREDVLTPTPLGPIEPEPDLTASRIASVTLAAPLVKVIAFGSGVRRALLEDS